MKEFIIEARINEWADRELNPHVPWTIDEIVEAAVECAAAGAAIIHFHQRDDSGAPDYRYERLAKIVEAIRARTDVLINPSLGVGPGSTDAQQRLANVLRLSDDGLAPDMVPVDMSSSDMDWLDPETHRFKTTDQVYLNTTALLEYFAVELRNRAIKPQAVVPHVPGLRRTLAFLRNGSLEAPLNLQFVMTGPDILSGHPPTLEGLDAFCGCLPQDSSQLEWSAIAFHADLMPLVGEIARRGGHVALGLGDYPYVERGSPSNSGLIKETAEIARSADRAIATPADARRLLGICTPSARSKLSAQRANANRYLSGTGP